MSYALTAQSAALLGRTVEVSIDDTGEIVQGKVEAIRLENGLPEIIINGKSYPLGSIVAVYSSSHSCLGKCIICWIRRSMRDDAIDVFRRLGPEKSSDHDGCHRKQHCERQHNWIQKFAGDFSRNLKSNLANRYNADWQPWRYQPTSGGVRRFTWCIATHHTPGNLQQSGSDTDVAIQGDGYFVIGSGDQRFFTRAGAFGFDENGSLVNITNGMHVYGWHAQNGVVNTNQPIEPLRVPTDQMIAPVATTRIEYSGNLDSRTTGTLAFDGKPMVISNGTNEVSVSFELTPTGSFNEWHWRADVTGGTVLDENGDPVGAMAFGTIRVGPTGEIIFQSATGPIKFNLMAQMMSLKSMFPQRPTAASFLWWHILITMRWMAQESIKVHTRHHRQKWRQFMYSIPKGQDMTIIVAFENFTVRMDLEGRRPTGQSHR